MRVIFIIFSIGSYFCQPSYPANDTSRDCPSSLARLAGIFTKVSGQIHNKQKTANILYTKLPGTRKHYGFLSSVDHLTVGTTDLPFYIEANATKSIRDYSVPERGNEAVDMRIGWNQTTLGGVEGELQIKIEVRDSGFVNNSTASHSKFEALAREVAKKEGLPLDKIKFSTKNDNWYPNIKFTVDKSEGIDRATRVYRRLIELISEKPDLIYTEKVGP